MLLPAFEVKKRLLSMDSSNDVSNMDIWNYLAKNKWSFCYNLTISEMVNDIIDFDANNIV